MSQVVSQQESPARPKVSVVIVAYECEAALRRCLTALDASQDRANIEVLVVDAGSRDGCPRIDADFPGIQMLRLPRNFGRTRARNIGMRTAQSDLIFFLDPNVEVQPETVSILAAALEATDAVTAAAPQLRDASGTTIVNSFSLPTPEALAEASLRGTPLPRVVPQNGVAEAVDEEAMIVRKSFLAGMNYLDEKRFSEHWSLLEVCWQIRNAGKQILVSQQTFVVLNPSSRPVEDEQLYTADRVSGASAFIAKHSGFGAGISFKLKCFFSALGSLKLGLAFSILSGSKLDPTQ
ncbi:glycosyltransferase family 2 protein [Paludibaculum fermentans]|uniref:glycosyltransferase family 2 protein n=1 Tax=Paludibaculum fermentans TaxID=1473598 RepID=UPI003EC07187